MSNPKGMPSNNMIATAMARKIFAKRGNHSEAHLSELELAAIVEGALDVHANLASNLELVQQDQQLPALLRRQAE